MFSLRTDASKIALAALVSFCIEHQVPLLDCQFHTAHLASLGAVEVSRAALEAHVAAYASLEGITDWAYHPAMWAHLLTQPAGL
jgi:leucyl/phenylalanyl-tRNA--protein transferase